MAGKHMREADETPARTTSTRRSAPTATPTRRSAPAPASRSNRKGGGAGILSNVLLVVGIALLVVAGVMWARAQLNYHQQDEVNEMLAAYAEVSDDGETPPQVDWAALKAVNDDVVGWVQIPGTVINYPVYQADDNDYYLNTNAEGVYGVGGQIFLDYANWKPGMLDQQTIIYGHHLKNGAMFKQIADMDNQGFFDSVGTVWYVTEGATYKLQPLFVYHTDPDDTNVRVFSFGSDEEFHEYLLGILREKGVTSDANVEAIIAGTSRVLTLSTCNYIDGSGRTILVCVEQSEAELALNPTS